MISFLSLRVIPPLLVVGLTATQAPGQTNLEALAARARGDRALIVVGLPGDAEHDASFRELARTYRQWLTGALEFPETGVRILFGALGEPGLKAGPATREAIAQEVATIRDNLAPAGRLWVFLLGHASERGGRYFLHLPGPDLRDDEVAKLFEGLTCREQVFWVTTAGSGGFLAALSTKGRIVITATTPDQELNETEFPHALAEVCRQAPEELDQDADGKVSIWDLFLRLGTLVEARFAADQRTPTEHALLDDNGDRVGTERPDPELRQKDAAAQKKGKPASTDGDLAKKTILPKKIR